MADRAWKEGRVDAWFGSADPLLREVCETVNGPLIAAIAEWVKHEDTGVADIFRLGIPLFGDMPVCGLGEERLVEKAKSIEGLRAASAASNERLLETIKEGEHAQELLRLTKEDAALGRMSEPVPVEYYDLSEVRLVPRFGVHQGEYLVSEPCLQRALYDCQANVKTALTKSAHAKTCHGMNQPRKENASKKSRIKA